MSKTSMKRILRCSSSSLAEDCAQSLEQPAISVIGDDLPSGTGSMAHDLFEGAILLGDSSLLLDFGAADREQRLKTMGELFGANYQEAARLAYAGWKLWREDNLCDLFPDPTMEEEVVLTDEATQTTMTGHVDVRALVPNEVRAADLKNGFLDLNAEPQYKGYALGLMRKHSVDNCFFVGLRSRDGVRDVWQWTRDELEAWWTRFVAHLGRMEYRKGLHCTRCKRWSVCPAATELVRESRNRLISLTVAGDLANRLTSFGPAEIVDLYDARKIVERAAEDADLAIRIEVDRRGGKVLREDGAGIGFKVTHPREVNVRIGLPVLEHFLGADMYEALDLTKERAEQIIRDHAPPRMKGKQVKEFYTRLEADGAIVTKEVRSLVAMRETPATKQLQGTVEELEQIFGIEIEKEPITKAASAAEASGESK